MNLYVVFLTFKVYFKYNHTLPEKYLNESTLQ